MVTKRLSFVKNPQSSEIILGLLPSSCKPFRESAQHLQKNIKQFRPVLSIFLAGKKIYFLQPECCKSVTLSEKVSVFAACFLSFAVFELSVFEYLVAPVAMAVLTANRVTYSPALTLVPTYECFNRCQYCNFRVNPEADEWMSLQTAEARLQQAQSLGVIEILILTGEVHPQSPRRLAWLQRIYDLCDLAISMGFLPHTNAGPLSSTEMVQLKQVNVSMGLMIEQMTPDLLTGVHRYAPSKRPDIRQQQLEQAGQLKIPFTTGLLLGIGESIADRIESLQAIAACHDRWGHIQEVILQPHQPGISQAEPRCSFSAEELATFVTTARHYLPPEITLQIPPNLVGSKSDLLAAIANGARDLGGLGPLDEVNPTYFHPTVNTLEACLQPAGWELRPRLPVYPQYDDWLPMRLRDLVTQWRDTLMNHSVTPKSLSDYLTLQPNVESVGATP